MPNEVPQATPKKQLSPQEQFVEAAENGNIQEMDRLLNQYKGKIDIDGDGSIKNSNALISAVLGDPAKALSTVQFLLSKGAKGDKPTEFPAIIFAVAHNDVEIVKALLEHGANPRQEMPHGLKPLDEPHNFSGVTPMDVFAGSPEIFKLLTDYDQKLNNPDNKRKLPSLLDHRSQNGFTPLMNVVSLQQISHPEAVKFLIEQGANVRATATFGEKPTTALKLTQDDIKFQKEFMEEPKKEEADPKNKVSKSYNRKNPETGKSPHEANVEIIQECTNQINNDQKIIQHIQKALDSPQHTHASVHRGNLGKSIAFAKSPGDLPAANGHLSGRQQKPSPMLEVLIPAAGLAAQAAAHKPSAPGPRQG